MIKIFLKKKHFILIEKALLYYEDSLCFDDIGADEREDVLSVLDEVKKIIKELKN